MAEINELLMATYRLSDGEESMSQGCVAVLDVTAEGNAKNPGGEGAGNIAGVLRDTQLAAGRTGAFQVAGIAKVRVSESVDIGDLLIVADVQGRVRPRGVLSDSGCGIVGRAISAAGTANSMVKCILGIPEEIIS